jgi:hypothetical protein
MMRLLILSESIFREQRFGKIPYTPPYDVDLDVGELNDPDGLAFSAFDYDVTVVHVINPEHHSIGYFLNIPKVSQDAKIALENGRSIICLPQSHNFRPERQRGSELGAPVYAWIKQLGIELQDNLGEDIKASGAGKAQAIQEYLEYAPRYHQVVINPSIALAYRLAVVDDTDIVVGLEYPVCKGMLVILPPPLLNSQTYFLALSKLVGVARRYYERSQRRIPVGDIPDWLTSYRVPRAIELDEQIKKLEEEKAEYDKLAYVLYGTGDELEDSVALLLRKLGLIVDPQPSGANIDLKARHPRLNIGFAVEVTGTKGTIQKDSNKAIQAWQYLNDRSGTSEEDDRLVIVANTEYHLDPTQRRSEPFSPPVVKLLGSNGVLLITTTELYQLWKAIHEGMLTADDVISNLHKKSGLYQSN